MPTGSGCRSVFGRNYDNDNDQKLPARNVNKFERDYPINKNNNSVNSIERIDCQNLSRKNTNNAQNYIKDRPQFNYSAYMKNRSNRMNEEDVAIQINEKLKSNSRHKTTEKRSVPSAENYGTHQQQHSSTLASCRINRT